MLPYLKEYYELQERNKRLRSERMAAARAKGTHTKQDWNEMKEFFRYTCVRCLDDGDYVLEKDHIVPIYQGGSHGLDNIQPLCRRCNRSKTYEDIDWRPKAASFFNIELPEKYKQKSNG